VDAWVVPALLGTLAWGAILVWRLGRHPPALWKGLVLSAAGLTLNWLLLMSLWLPLLNYGFGQAPVSRRVAALVPPGACVQVFGLDAVRITGLRHHGGLVVRRTGSADADGCPVLVTTVPQLPQLALAVDLSEWQLRAEFPRLRAHRERWLVFERRTAAGLSAPPAPAPALAAAAAQRSSRAPGYCQSAAAHHAAAPRV
jgi:hypothetical protein